MLRPYRLTNLSAHLYQWLTMTSHSISHNIVGHTRKYVMTLTSPPPLPLSRPWTGWSMRWLTQWTSWGLLVLIAYSYGCLFLLSPHAAFGWRIHWGVEVTALSTNKQLSLSSVQTYKREEPGKTGRLCSSTRVPHGFHPPRTAWALY